MSRLRQIVESDWFRRTVMIAILVNAIHIGLETDPGIVRRYGSALHIMDVAVLALFTVEMLLRLAACSPLSAFLREPWNWFDTVVIGAGFLPGSQFLTVFRLLRILRLMRTVRVLPGLKRITEALFASIPSLANVGIILFLLFYMYATAGTLLYGAILPQKFGSLGLSLLTLFQVVTLESWSLVMTDLLPQAPYAWVFFVSFIVLGGYVALSSAVAILVGNLSAGQEIDELAKIRQAVARIEARLERLPR
ncbi:MAG: ion transporter [Elusimicrobia bacterium]|nr:ion transporter [Elusimicrobiota bacterium]